MKPIYFIIAFLAASAAAMSQTKPADNQWDYESSKAVMSQEYWNLWNADVQGKIDNNIHKYRQADATLRLTDVAEGTTVTIEQISHEFIFGASIFNFNQLGTEERNKRYKSLFGTLFNSATIPFYWKSFEMQPGRLRFKEEYWDTEYFWNTVNDPKSEPHWRRPAPDPIIAYCEAKGIRMHGHNFIWGNTKWHNPEWLFDQFCPPEEKEKLAKAELSKLTPNQIAALAPTYTAILNRFFDKRINDIAHYYGGRLQSWDIVNESAVDFHGNAVTGDPITNSHYGILMPGDYTYKALKKANEVLPSSVALNINDYANNQNYADQVKSLIAHGARIDIMGSQMHLFKPQQCLDISLGKEIETPQIVWEKMNIMSQAHVPIHLSEITITAPTDDEKGRLIQSVIAYNLYRLWFSIENMMGITWWNIVDDCGAPGEPTTSGLFTRNMEAKPAYYALNRLINEEWTTSLSVSSDGKSPITFRGFKGKYRVTWKNKSGESKEMIFQLHKDGDGF